MTGGPGAEAPAITVALTREDHVELNLHLSEKPDLWRRRWRLAVVICAIGILLPWVGVLPGILAEGWPPTPAAVAAVWPFSADMAVVAALWLPALPALTRWSLRRQFRHWFAQSGTPLGGRRDIEARPEGLFLRGERSPSQFAWSGITAIVETPAHLFLMAGETQAHLIPKRDVPEKDLRAFRDAVAARTGLSPMSAKR